MDEVERLQRKMERLEVVLFAVVRNNAVLPLGLRLGKSEEEISRMTLATIDSIAKKINYKKMRELIALARKGENHEI